MSPFESTHEPNLARCVPPSSPSSSPRQASWEVAWRRLLRALRCFVHPSAPSGPRGALVLLLALLVPLRAASPVALLSSRSLLHHRRKYLI